MRKLLLAAVAVLAISGTAAIADDNDDTMSLADICEGVVEASVGRVAASHIQAHVLGATPMWCKDPAEPYEVGQVLKPTECFLTSRTSFHISIPKPPKFHAACVVAIVSLFDNRRENLNELEVQILGSSALYRSAYVHR